MTINIDALHLLILGEISLILLLSTLYLFSRNRKHKKLYQKTLKELSDMREGMDAFESQKTEEPLQKQEVQEQQPITEPFEESQPSMSTEEEVDESSLAGKVNKLQRIINFQKGKILDLMCYKDIFEGAQRKLHVVQDSYHNLKDRFIRLLGESSENKGLAEALEVFENNNNELNSYMEILAKENETLAEKFRAWEEELKKIWEEAEQSEAVDEGKYAEVMGEKTELLEKLKEFEGKLEEKSKLFEDMQKQYEDLEKEYMILYRQQQAANQANQ